jgi:hypothetical protein
VNLLFVTDFDERQAEGQGLTRTRLGLADDIDAFEKLRDRLLLDWSRCIYTTRLKEAKAGWS